MDSTKDQLPLDFLQYLTKTFPNPKYKNKSLIDLYTYDKKLFNTLKKKNLITDEALSFFNQKGNDLNHAANISIDALKKLEYTRIINVYMNSFANSNKPNDNNIPKGDDNTHRSAPNSKIAIHPQSIVRNEKPLHCYKDMNVLTKISEKVVTTAGRKDCLRFPTYECSICKRKYTSVSNYKDLSQMNLKGTKYTNILFANDEIRYRQYCKRPKPVKPGSKCLVCANQTNLVHCKKCNAVLEAKEHIFTINNKNCSTEYMFVDTNSKTSTYKTKYCPNCHTYYITYNEYLCHRKDWILLNPEDIPKLQKAFKKEMKKQKRAKEEALKKEQEKRNQRLKEYQENQLKIKKEQELKRKKAIQEADLLNKKIKSKHILEQKAKAIQDNLPNNDNKALHQHNNNIQVRDFVVRRSTFKCLHEKHHIQNIDATLRIIDRNGEIITTRVPAGYCPNCNIFFILESTYQYLKTIGTPICRISDEKTYIKTRSISNGLKLAQESLLMQYGYNVSQTESLSSMRRRKILAVLVDNDILTRSDIISYLDFFINQRKYQPKYEKAIEKWVKDREFISEYKTGNYTEYGVKGIHRKS